jgi:6-pyruvoyltetrahydropterin/6-carboxytetrahydropterin synthase
MSYSISKEFRFEAAHQLHGLPEDHPCGRIHGHSYRVVIELSSEELDDHGFITDYGNLKPFGAYLDTTFDHRFLNEVLIKETGEEVQPSAERLAWFFCAWLLNHLPLVVETLRTVRVSETAKTWAEYRL